MICGGQLDAVVPIEPSSMPGRTVIQWDKEDCADMKIIKVDLLGLGMMAVLKDCLTLVPAALRRAAGSGATSAERSADLSRAANRPTRWECSRWRAGRRWRHCRATIQCAFTIWWCRWPSSVPGPSWAT